MDKTNVQRAVYIRNSVISAEEDLTLEFKGHRNFFAQDLPGWSLSDSISRQPSTRRQLSRDINAFLNTGKGGTILIGILDDGTVKGINLTEYQKDHICITMDDLMNCYSPPVPRHRYKIKFVPVIEKEDIDKKDNSNFDSSLTNDPEMRSRAHTLRTKRYCWCDIDANAQLAMGIIPPFYIVEVIVKPWKETDARNIQTPGSKLQLYPIYQDEERKCYVRLQSSIVNYSYQDVKDMTAKEVKMVYENRIEQLQAELEKLNAQL